ncbi:hypothetical protein PG997_000231 [Apiospora hydei]|uniref:Uncharacterized protein n=1 Tax=Apiospora hydei TaxID=1337664 RepID=A0ABR1X9Z8_9PEZI
MCDGAPRLLCVEPTAAHQESRNAQGARGPSSPTCGAPQTMYNKPTTTPSVNLLHLDDPSLPMQPRHPHHRPKHPHIQHVRAPSAGSSAGSVFAPPASAPWYRHQIFGIPHRLDRRPHRGPEHVNIEHERAALLGVVLGQRLLLARGAAVRPPEARRGVQAGHVHDGVGLLLGHEAVVQADGAHVEDPGLDHVGVGAHVVAALFAVGGVLDLGPVGRQHHPHHQTARVAVPFHFEGGEAVEGDLLGAGGLGGGGGEADFSEEAMVIEWEL